MKYPAIFQRKKINTLLITLSSIFILGCGGSLKEIAQKNLYPYDSANKTITPEVGENGYTSLDLKVDLRLNSDDKEGPNEPLGAKRVNAWFYKAPSNNAPVVMFFHGNGTNIGSLNKYGILKSLKSFGYHVMVVDYPSYGRSQGYINQENILRAADGAFAWVQSKYSSNKKYVWGRSLGCAVAVQFTEAHNAQVSKLVLTSPWHHLKSLMEHHFGGLADSVPDSWKNRNKWDSNIAANNIKGTTVVVQHGDKDTLIPTKFGIQLADEFNQTSSKLSIYKEIGHNDMYSQQALWQEISTFYK